MTLSESIQAAKAKLPLSDLLQQLGDGEHAKKSAKSPFRNGDNKHCFGIYQKTNGEWNFKDQVTGEFGDEIDYIALRFGISKEEATTEYLKLAGVEREKPASKFAAAMNGHTPKFTSPAFDWPACVAAMADHVGEVSAWRGFQPAFLEAFRSTGGIGWHEGQVAFPVHDPAGKVIGCHYRMDSGDWFYTRGCRVSPVVIGSPDKANEIILCESQWDALAIADRLDWHTWPNDTELAIVATRGAGNGALAKDFAREGVRFVMVPQNDKPDPKTGKIPAEEWASTITESLDPFPVYRLSIPEKFKDANDWTLDGISGADIWEALAGAKLPPSLTPVYSVRELMDFDVANDPDCILGDRWLGKTGTCMWIGPSGMGKSALCFQAAMYWALGLPFFGIKPKRPLRSVIYQAEDDKGDCAEFFQGIIKGMIQCDRINLEGDMLNLLDQNFIVVRNVVHSGDAFAKFARRDIAARKADMAWINPLFSYAGCSISDQAQMSDFLRNKLNPIAMETGCCWHIVHHTAKPSSDAKARSNWSDSDYAYIGFGSAEITNWARSINVIQAPKDSPKKLLLAKRGSRAKATPDPSSPHEYGNAIYLSHHEEFIFWLQTNEPAEEREKKQKRASNTIAELSIVWPASYSELVQAVQNSLKLGLSAAKMKVSRWAKDGVIRKNSDDRYRPVTPGK